MSNNILRLAEWCLLVAALFALTAEFAPAGNAPLVSAPMLSGSYEVLQNTGHDSQVHGSQAQIRMRIRLVNHGSSNLSIQRMTLWDFSHPYKDGSHACAVTLRAHASAETTQEFTIRRSQYQLWQKGMRPRFVLQMETPANAAGRTITMKSTAVVRLDRISDRFGGEEAK